MTTLNHPGTWLPGDQIVDSLGDLWTRKSNGKWARDGAGWLSVKWDDALMDEYLEWEHPKPRITRLMPGVR
jgi:hypothetical protein